jgi:hypothetical protein
MLARTGVETHDEGLERRSGERRTTGSATDVSRVEHENLFRQVHDILRRVEKIELEMHVHDARLEALEKASVDTTRRARRSK